MSKPAAAPPPAIGSPSAARRRRRRRWLVALALLSLGLATTIYSIARRALDPAALRARVDELLKQQLAVPFELGDVRFVAPSGIAVDALRIENPPGARTDTAITVPALAIRWSWWALLTRDQPLTEVTIDGAIVHVALLADGRLSLSSLLQPRPPAAAGIELPEISVRNARIITCPDSLYRCEEPFTIARASLTRGARGQHRLVAFARHPRFEVIEVDGTLSSAPLALHATASLRKLRLDESVADRLPAVAWVERWKSYDPRGEIDASIEFVLPSPAEPRWGAQVVVRGGRFHTGDGTVAVTGLSGAVAIDARRCEITAPLLGNALQAQLQLTGRVLHSGFDAPNWDLHLRLERLPIHPGLPELVTGGLRELLDEFQPSGLLHASLRLRGAGAPVVELENLGVEGVQLRPQRWPFPLTNVHGTIVRTGPSYALELSGGAGAATWTLTGTADAMDATGAFQLRFQGQDLPIREILAQAQAETVRRIISEYAPGGRGSLQVDVHRATGAEIAELKATLALASGEMCFHKFRYPLASITGEVELTGRLGLGSAQAAFLPIALACRDVRGYQGDHLVTLRHGTVDFGGAPATTTPRIDLQLDSPRLTIDSELRNAFAPELRRLFEHLGLAGSAGAAVRIYTSERGTVEFQVDAHLNEGDRLLLAADPVPYPLQFRSGRLTYDSVRRATTFEQFRSEPVAGATLTVDGSDLIDPNQPSREAVTTVHVVVEALPDTRGLDLANAELRAHFPPDLRAAGLKLALAGALRGEMRGRYLRPLGAGELHLGSEFQFEGQATLQDASGDFGLRLSQIDAEVAYRGTIGLEPGAASRVTAELSNGSFRFNRVHVHAATASFSFGRDTSQPMSTPNKPDGKPRSRLRMLLNQADLYDGDLRGRLTIDLDDSPRFTGQFNFGGVDLSVGSMDLFGTGDIAGAATGEVVFSGETRRPESITGHGRIDVREARLSSLPPVAGLLSSLSNPLSAIKALNPQNREFTSGEVGFLIQNETFVLREMGDLALHSEIADLNATGHMDFQRNYDLQVELATRNGIPLVGWLLDKASRVRLRGSLDAPIPVMGEPASQGQP